MKGKKKTARKGALKKTLAHVSRYKLMIAASILLAAGTVTLTLYVPILIGRAIDLIVGKGSVDFEAMLRILAKAAVLVCATAVMQWVMNIINNRVAFLVVRDVRNEAFAKLQTLPLSYIDSHVHGDLVSRIIADVDQFSDGLLMGFTQFFTGVVTIIGTLGFMLSLDWMITLVVVILTPASLFIARGIARSTFEYFKTQSEIRGEQTALLDELITNQRTVKAFAHEEQAISDFDEINERLTKASVKAVFFSSLTNPSTRFVNSLIYAAVALCGAVAIIKWDLITVGELTCFLSYANQYTKPFNEISGVITELQNALACADRVFELIEAEPQTPDKENARRLQNAGGHVELKDVSFSYTPDVKLIEHLDLDAKPGMRIAIVGPTGCGKTTLINLLMRFYDIDSGSVSVDGTDVRDITRSSLRRSYGMVLQETWIKTGTVRENIVMGKPDASDEEIRAAARATHADRFIDRLPEGYDTVISDSSSLSQGQKQLLCITRVILSLPPMLILDEATSSIDTRTEAIIQASFAKMMEGRTSFIVAHRLSTIREADVILVMKDGHIIEQGAHAELLKKGGSYAKLYNSQFDV